MAFLRHLWRLTRRIVGLGLAVSPALAANHWPQWRGPLATGVAPEANPPLTWSETNHVKWRFEIPGYGTSTPIVWGDRVFVLSAVPTGKKPEAPAPPRSNPEGQRTGGGFGSEQPTEIHRFVVIAVDRTTGRLAWEKTAREELPHEGHHRDHGFASFSPVTDGQLLIAYFGSRGLYAYDLGGDLKWTKDLGDMQTRNGFGEGGSLALHGDTVVVNWDHEGEDFIVALDKTSGEERWRRPRAEITTWATPLVVEYQGKPQVVVNATQKIRSYDLSTGEPLWECGGMTQNVIPTPVPGADLVYVTSGFRGSALLAIRLGRTGDLTDTDAIAWRHQKNTPYVPSPLLYGDRIYFLSGNNGMLSCLDARTGAPRIDAERIPGLPNVYASPVGASDRVYLAGRDGQTVVLRHADQLEILATNRLDDRFDASPAIVGRELFLRGHRYLYCLAE